MADDARTSRLARLKAMEEAIKNGADPEAAAEAARGEAPSASTPQTSAGGMPDMQAFSRGVTEGFTLGFPDEAAGLGAAAGALVGTGSPSLALDAYREGRDEARTTGGDHPWLEGRDAARADSPALFTAGMLGGGLATGAGPAFGAGARAAQAGASMLVPAVKTGAAYGGLSGAGMTDESALGDIALEAGKGALLGGALGGVGYGLGKGAQTLVRGYQSRGGASQLVRDVLSESSILSPGRGLAKWLGRPSEEAAATQAAQQAQAAAAAREAADRAAQQEAAAKLLAESQAPWSGASSTLTLPPNVSPPSVGAAQSLGLERGAGDPALMAQLTPRIAPPPLSITPTRELAGIPAPPSRLKQTPWQRRNVDEGYAAMRPFGAPDYAPKPHTGRPSQREPTTVMEAPPAVSMPSAEALDQAAQVRAVQQLSGGAPAPATSALGQTARHRPISSAQVELVRRAMAGGIGSVDQISAATGLPAEVVTEALWRLHGV